MCRVGEAANPGPRPEPSDFVLGAFNPSGLNGKAPLIVSQLTQGDIWAVSETHLCRQNLHKFKSSMHFAEGHYRYCVGGHPVPIQSNRMFHSAWKGVAVLSKHPTRAVPTNWPRGVFESSRILVTATLMQDVWLTGATVYGEPESTFYPNAKANNQVLLNHAVEQICHLSLGPRFVAGDWNVSPDTLPAFDALKAAGFCDLQDIACAQWGQSIQNTCKFVTRKDYCFISRELQHLLKEVHVAADIFPDHAVLWGVFHSLAQVLPRQVWFTPKQFPWPGSWNVDPSFWNNLPGNCDDKYHALWNHIETQAVKEMPFAPPKQTMGRARTTKTNLVQEGKVSPLKRAREGEVQPHFVAATFRHAQWLRQARRLQAYVKYVAAHGTHTEHARALWGSIVRAAGFKPSFMVWWRESPWKTCGAPALLPLIPPDMVVGSRVFDTVMLAFRALEQELTKSSRQYARLKREQNPNIIFQDIRSYANKGVEVLLKATSVAITEVRHDEGAVVLQRPVEFDHTKPIVCCGKPLSVIHHEADCVWVEETSNLEPGMTIAQSCHKGTTDELFHIFLEAWRSMWGRHQNVPLARWKTTLDFARAQLPCLALDWASLDAGTLASCITRKKKTTTAGLDGVSIVDLRSMCPAALSNFTALYLQAESTGEWPTQMLAGRVTCLAKVEEPCHALDFRPITVIGILFRCWGTHHAKKAIRHLDEHLPQGLFGSRPTRYAGQVWSHLLWCIEQAYENQLPLSGIIADIRKAFNYLPRLVVLEACALFGIPMKVLVAWAGALANMPRRFQFHGNTSQPAYSTCGLPEGCALSCLGMIIIDTLFHKWMVHFFPMCQPLSYVDDWQIIVADPHRIPGVFACMERFVGEIDLLLDSRKTHTWSIQAAGRAHIRDQGFDASPHGKNLGAHVQYSRQHTNKALMARVAEVAPLWAKLRLSACAYVQKVRAVLCAAWPRAMHGIAATTMSLTTFQNLRAGAMRGLKEDSAGANAQVHLGLIERATTDPHCWAILQTFRLTRDCGSPMRVEPLLAALAGEQVSLPGNTITQTLLHRIQILGWHVTLSGALNDFFGSFSLFEVSITELIYRVEFQWTYVVAHAVSHRPCFHGLEGCDPSSTRDWLASLDVSDRALFRKVLNGTHITQDGKKYCQEATTDVCPFCECSDSRYHRFWECEYFGNYRQHLTRGERETVRDLPAALTCSGWSIHPTTQFAWNTYFATMTEAPLGPIHGQDNLHLFTDGSCVDQHLPSQRFAAWSLIRAGTSTDTAEGTAVLAAQPLPGLLQSAVRAEVYAVLQALRVTAEYDGPVFIWTDSDAVVRRFRRIQAGHTVLTNSAHADLWKEIAQLLHACNHPCQITHVSAHRDPCAAENFLQEWCFVHNALADRMAVQANYSRDRSFWQLWATHQQACQVVAHYNRLVQGVQLTISQAVVRMEKPIALEEAGENAEEVPVDMVWDPLPPLQIPVAAVRWYGDPMVRSIVSWFWQGLSEGDANLVPVSHFQLYADYMLATGLPGPVHLHPGPRWLDGQDVANLELRGFGYKQRTRWFTKVWKEVLRHQGIALRYGYQRPRSQMILMYTGVAFLPWPQYRITAVDKWMLGISGVTFSRQTKLLDALPFARQHCQFPPFVLTSYGL